MKMTGASRTIEKLEADLWEAADNLRANSKLTSSDYFMPVLGVIFLRHAPNRFEAASEQIAADEASGKMPKRMRKFNSEQITGATSDVFGRIYEYFLARFSIQKAHDNGEFCTPSSIVQTIVNVIEPDHGTVFDPACGSGGMFVQSSHFIEDEGGDTSRKVVFDGQEKNNDTIRIAKMNVVTRYGGQPGRDLSSEDLGGNPQ